MTVKSALNIQLHLNYIIHHFQKVRHENFCKHKKELHAAAPAPKNFIFSCFQQQHRCEPLPIVYDGCEPFPNARSKAWFQQQPRRSDQSEQSG